MQKLHALSAADFENLCDSTQISVNLLTSLKTQKVITDELCGQIGGQFDPKTRAHTLYNFLKICGENVDLPKLMKALKESCNAQAIIILNRHEPVMHNSSTPRGPVSQILTVSTSEGLALCLEDAGCIVNLSDGEYRGPFILRQDFVQVVGNGPGTILRAGCSATCFDISGGGCTVSNVSIIRSDVGIILRGIGNTIKQVQFDNTGDAVTIEGNWNTVDTVTMTNLTQQAHGIVIRSHGNVISNITGTGVRYGIVVDGSNNDLTNIHFQRRGNSSIGMQLFAGAAQNRISNLNCARYSLDKGDCGLSSEESLNCSVENSVCGPVKVSGCHNLTLKDVDCGDRINIIGGKGVKLRNCEGVRLQAAKTVKVKHCHFMERAFTKN